ncbi:hypothetical protein C806_00895 [Lachnospiraceae bacterium 3-1]|nr:hypothetical protein C806_00895 [Lachnospiraceae bacterium 3-1]
MILFGNPDRFCRGIGESRKFKKRISFSSIFFVSYLTQADLRHSHVSLLISMGFSAVSIGNRVGHESVDITFRYAHMFPTEQIQMAELLNAEFKEGTEE